MSESRPKEKFTWTQGLWAAAGLCLLGSAILTLVKWQSELVELSTPLGLVMFVTGGINIIIYKRKQKTLHGSHWLLADGMSTALLSVFLLFKPRLSSRGSTHITVVHGTARLESLVGKPRGKASRERHRSLIPREGKRDTAARAREESPRACPHSSRGLTAVGRLQKYPKIHVCTGEGSSGSGTESTQGLRPQHRRERNPERPPSYSHGDWPFLRAPERITEVPIISREHLPQLEKIQEFLPSRRHEAHLR